MSKRREAAIITVSLLFLALGIGIVWLVQGVAELEGDAVLVSLLVIPIVLYLLLSGRLQELKGPGGWEIKLAAVASQAVDPASQEVPFERVELIEKGAPSLRAEDFDENTPIVMSLVQGGAHYARPAVLERLTQLAQFRSLRFLVVLDEDERVLAYLPHRSAARLLNDPDRGEQFIALVNGNNPNAFATARLPGVVTTTLPARSSNTDALKIMEAQNLEALVVVDDKGRSLGVVDRAQVLSKMLLAVTAAGSR
jgi:CBS domain-containing protein